MELETLTAIRRDYESAGVRREVSPDDEMWRAGPEWYFTVGESAVDAILASLAHSPLDQVRAILDLPCGHGRIARHLRAAFPDAAITYCDLLRSGVDFCRDTFGGEGVYSEPDLLKTPLRSYDLIWVGSLFTHVRASLAAAWLGKLCKHLSPNGLLVATFHGRWSIEVNKVSPMLPRRLFRKALLGRALFGWGYVPYPGSADGAFGISLSTPSKILQMASGIEGIRVLSFTERGWADNHDVLVLGRPDRLKPWG